MRVDMSETEVAVAMAVSAACFIAYAIGSYLEKRADRAIEIEKVNERRHLNSVKRNPEKWSKDLRLKTAEEIAEEAARG